MIAGKILHSGCVTCIECHKSIGEGAFEQVDDDIYCVNCYSNTITKKDDSSINSAIRYGSMK